MLLLSRLINAEVRGPDGRLLGRIADLIAVLGRPTGAALVDRLVVRAGKNRELVIDWTAVIHFDGFEIQVANGGSAITSVTSLLRVDEIFLRRDVLDTQIVDVGGQRLARVADVVLARRPDRRLEIVAVEVGFGAVVRRLGLARCAAHLPGDAVAWSELHMTSARGHTAQLAVSQSPVHRLRARDLATLICHLKTGHAVDILAARGPALASDVIQLTGPVAGQRILRAMGESDAAEVIAAMPVRHAQRWRELVNGEEPGRSRPLLRSRIWPRRRHERRWAG